MPRAHARTILLIVVISIYALTIINSGNKVTIILVISKNIVIIDADNDNINIGNSSPPSPG